MSITHAQIADMVRERAVFTDQDEETREFMIESVADVTYNRACTPQEAGFEVLSTPEEVLAVMRAVAEEEGLRLSEPIPTFVVGRKPLTPEQRDAPMPPVYPEPTVPGTYLRLFHGRKTPDEHLDDWGADGPYIGPLQWFHTTYLRTVRYCLLGEDDGTEIDVVSDLLKFNGMYYGDWSVFVVAEVAHKQALLDILAHSDRMDNAEDPQAPTGDDYNALLDIARRGLG